MEIFYLKMRYMAMPASSEWMAYFSVSGLSSVPFRYDILNARKNLARMPPARDGLSVVGTLRRFYSTEGVHLAQGDRILLESCL